MKKTILILGIIFLFIVSIISPISFGNNIKLLDFKGELPINTTQGNPPEEEWNRTFGDSTKEKYDAGKDVQQTTDGGYIIAGTTKSQGDPCGDFWLIKTNESGIEQWNKTYGGMAGDFARSVLQINDGGYVLLGETASYGAGDYDCWLVKTDNSGNELWNKTYGGSGRESSESVHMTYDGGYLLVGWTRSFGNGNSDFWLVKTDANGIEEWNKTYGGLDSEQAWDGQVTSDGGIVIAGFNYTKLPYDCNILLIKTDMYGNEEWSKKYGNVNFLTAAYSVQQTKDNGFIISGQGCYNGSYDLLLLKTDMYGEEQWNKTFEGEACFDSAGYSVQQTPDGGFIATGTTEIIGDFYCSALLVKTDINGNLQWYKTFNRTLHCRGWKVRQTNDKGYIIVGEIDFYGDVGGDVWLIKIAKENLPPNQPIITGPTNGKVGEEYCWNISSVEPDGDDLMYMVNWGDGYTTETECYPSGMEVEICHTYTAQGTYTIKVKAKECPDGLVGPEETFTITITKKSKAINMPFLNLLQIHPNMFLIIRHLLGL
ncbi:hypothetical protein AYK24_05670 [Thermoplasmatales archaeon SG8-52-4]|nr:MAG: hypothetical protein AYK24_05670 [Thermoplasmatales archaeon SG8-52-4]